MESIAYKMRLATQFELINIPVSHTTKFGNEEISNRKRGLNTFDG